jgi:hypothetical protein
MRPVLVSVPLPNLQEGRDEILERVLLNGVSNEHTHGRIAKRSVSDCSPGDGVVIAIWPIEVLGLKSVAPAAATVALRKLRRDLPSFAQTPPGMTEYHKASGWRKPRVNTFGLTVRCSVEQSALLTLFRSLVNSASYVEIQRTYGQETCSRSG